jgi:hypothetical protein
MMRRGFKAEAERNALSVREELGLSLSGALEPLLLAEQWGIPVVTTRQLLLAGARRRSVEYLTTAATNFSAATICEGTRRLIVYNTRHPPGRQANSLAHELSHVLLEHPPAPALADGGCRYWNAEAEEEADWQAAALLVPRDGAFQVLRLGAGLTEGAKHFGVSIALFRWRVNQTGVSRQLASMGYRHLAV